MSLCLGGSAVSWGPGQEVTFTFLVCCYNSSFKCRVTLFVGIEWCKWGPSGARGHKVASSSPRRLAAQSLVCSRGTVTSTTFLSTAIRVGVLREFCVCSVRVCASITHTLSFCLFTPLCLPRILCPYSSTDSSLFLHSSSRFSAVSGHRSWLLMNCSTSFNESNWRHVTGPRPLAVTKGKHTVCEW